MATTYKLTPREHVTVLRAEPDLLEVEGRWGPEGEPPPPHYHPDQDERFEVLEGRLRVRVEGEERELAAGETLEIPRGTSHQLWNPSADPARAIWQTRPAGRTEEWFSSIDALYGEGRVEPGGRPSPLAFAPLLSEYRDVFRLGAGPEPVTRPLISLLGLLGRIRGYRPGRGRRGRGG
ncbi:MAG: cupin domain-containing protein [Solirubrobacterales bacterium]